MATDKQSNDDARRVRRGGMFEDIPSSAAPLTDPFDDTDTTPSRALETTTARSETKVVPPATVRVCDECDVYYDAGDDWEFCPKCATALREVAKA